MADNSAIEWTDATWNPVTGCTKITRGCDNCYAARFAERWRGIEGHPYEQGFDLRLWPSRLDRPERWRKPRMIFVNSMSDLFHKRVPREFIDDVFDRMETTDRHIYQVLTKRSSRMRDYLRRRYRDGAAPGHIWCGVSVEDRPGRARIRHLQAAPATIRFLSIEPLIGPVGDHRPGRDCVGHRGRRERPERAPDGIRLGSRNPRPVRKRGRAVLLQAMGRTDAEGRRPRARRRGAQRHAGRCTEGKRPCPSNGTYIDNLTSGRPTGVARSAGAYPVRTGPFLSRRAGQILRSPQRGGVADPRPPTARQVTCISPGFLPPMGTRILRSASPRSS